MLLIIIGVFIIGWVCFKMQIYRKAERWTEAKGKMLSAGSEKFEEPQVYIKVSQIRPSVRYCYSYSGSEYVGSQVTLEDRSLKVVPADNHVFWERWPVNSEVIVYVNPRDPKESVLLREPVPGRRSHYIALCIAALLLCMAGGTLEYVWP